MRASTPLAAHPRDRSHPPAYRGGRIPSSRGRPIPPDRRDPPGYRNGAALLAASSLDVREDLEEVSVGIAEEQGAVAEDLVGGRGEEGDALADEVGGALVDFGDGDLEGQLKRGTPVGRWRISRSEARLGQGQGVVAHPIFDPTWRELSEE